MSLLSDPTPPRNTEQFQGGYEHFGKTERTRNNTEKNQYVVEKISRRVARVPCYRERKREREREKAINE